MFDIIMNFFKKFSKDENKVSKDTAKERLHLVLMQDRANVSADFMELMKQEIIEVIKKYIDVDENSIDVKLTNKDNGDGTTGAPMLYANIPIISIKEDAKKINIERNQASKKTIKEEKSVHNKEIDNKNKKAKNEKVQDIKKEEIVNNKTNEKDAKKEEVVVDNKANEKDVKKEEVVDNKTNEEDVKKEEVIDKKINVADTKKEENKDIEKQKNTNKTEVE